MSVLAGAVRHRAAHSLGWVGAMLILCIAEATAARADDSSEWFGEVYRGTTLGLSAGIVRRGASGRADGASTRRSRRGVQVASLGPDYGASVDSDEEEEDAAASKPARRSRSASLGDGSLRGKAAPSRRKQKAAKTRAPRKVRVASLGSALPTRPSFGPSLSGGAVRWAASPRCLNSGLRSVIAGVAATFGPVTVNSTCRSRRHNARVGGARRSHHLTGNAADFRVRGNWRGVWAFLRSSGVVGGIKHYGRGLFHIDTGPRRTW